MKHIYKIIAFLIVALFLFSSSAWAKDRYWVGGDGNWSDNTNHWAKRSGGAPGQSKPGSNDTAIFDSNSGGGTCTIDEAVNVRGFDMQSGNTTTISQGSNTITIGNKDAALTAGTFTGGSVNIDINGSFTLNGASFTSTSATMYCGDDFTISSGTFTHNSGTVEFDSRNLTITPSTITFNNVTFNANKTFTVATGTTLTVNGALDLTNGTVNTGTVDAKGAINLNSNFDGGTASLTATGTGDQTLTGGGSATAGDFLPLTINKSSGTLTLASTIRTSRDWTYTAGTVDEGTSTVVFAGGDTDFNGSMTFNNVTLDKTNNREVDIQSGTPVVNGTFTITDGEIQTGTLSAKGAVTIGADSDGGTGTISLTGTGAQTITGNSGGTFTDTLDINKTSGTATITGTCSGIQNITVTAGTLDFDGGYTYTIDDADSITVSSGATIDFTGSSGSLVTLGSDHAANDWSLNVNSGASYTADYVDVSRSDASSGQSIYATNSTDSGNNTNWFFIDQIIFTTAAQSLDPNQVSDIMTIEVQDAGGDAVNVGDDITIDLETTSGGGSFYSDSGGTNQITTVTILDGASSASFYYKDSTVGTPTITCSENPSKGWTDGQQTETIVFEIASFTVEASTPQVAGTSFNVTVTAKKADGTTDTSYTAGATLSLNYISPASGTKSLEGNTTIASFTQGVATTSVHYDDAGAITITATDDQGLGVTGTSSNIVVRPDSFSVTTTDTTQEAGTNFTLTITAENSKDETTPNYSGEVTLSTNYIDPNTGTKTVTSSTITDASFSSGIATVTDVNYTDCGTITITATDSTYVSGVNITGTSSNILFRPAKFSVTLSDIPANRTFYYIDEPFDITVTAQDANGNTTPNYRGTISITNASKVGLSSSYTFVAGDAGEHQFANVSDSSEESFTLGVSDTSYPQATGTSDTIEVKYGEIAVISTSGPVGTLEVDVRIRDSRGNILTSDNSTTFTVSLDESIDDGSATSAAATSSVTVSNGRATIEITDDESETVTVTPTSSPTLEPISGTVTFGTMRGGRLDFLYWKDER